MDQNAEPQEERGRDWMMDLVFDRAGLKKDLESIRQKVYKKDGSINFETPEFAEYSQAMYCIGIGGKNDPDMIPYIEEWEGAQKKAFRGFIISVISMIIVKYAIAGICIWQGIVHDWTWWVWVLVALAIFLAGNIVSSVLTFPIRLITKTTPQSIAYHMRLIK
jgi:hypothetical protein